MASISCEATGDSRRASAGEEEEEEEGRRRGGKEEKREGGEGRVEGERERNGRVQILFKEVLHNKVI